MGVCSETQGAQTGIYNNLERWEWARLGREIQEGGDIFKREGLIHVDV